MTERGRKLDRCQNCRLYVVACVERDRRQTIERYGAVVGLYPSAESVASI